MDRKEKIAEYICSSAYVPLKLDEMAIVLDVPETDRAELSDILDELIQEGRIFLTKKKRYCPVSAMGDTMTGELRCSPNGGFGIVCAEDGGEDVFIVHKSLGGAYDGDRVLVKIDSRHNAHGHSEGHVIKILSRGIAQLVGVVQEKKNGLTRVAADYKRFFSRVRVADEDLNGACEGDRVLVSIDGYDPQGKPFGKVLTVLGSSDSLITCIEGILMSSGITDEFPEAAAAEADAVPDSVSAEDLSGREDFRDKLIFTIDGDDSRDFDDAVSLERTENQNWLLGVHIADVTHYVADGSALDAEALRRATSVYFPHRVIPMLPKRLSNGICSLNPDTDRLTLSVLMEIDENGCVTSHRICESVIHSRARMTYNNVNKILAGDTVLREKYAALVPTLEEMARLSEQMEERRADRGAIDFNFPEAKIICDEDGNPTDVTVNERGRSQRLIESFMLAANETVAETAYWAELPFVYRVHDAPSNEKITAWSEFIKNFGYSFHGKPDSESIHPKDIQKVLEDAAGTPEETVIAQTALRSLMKACYRSTNDGHFGLAARYYCHFTSPIRRYPDLMIHRILKEFMHGRLDGTRQRYYEPRVKEAADISSTREAAADKAERDADDILKTAYMSRFIGESFDAVVSSVTSFGMFAMLENSCEGLIRCESMKGDFFEFDEDHRTLVGRNSGKLYKVGDIIRITVADCNVLMRRIDFVLEGDKKTQKRAAPRGKRRSCRRRKRARGAKRR